ncbi:hypothetical protein BsWGS_22648 [Bradybaena similaris]
MAALVDLRPRPELVNPAFDHYQLSLDTVPVYETPLHKSLDVAKPSETSFSSHHAKLFSLHNSLFPDPWDQASVYFCDREWNIAKVFLTKGGKPELSDPLLQLPDAANLRLKPGRFNVTLSFPSNSLAVVVNGVDTLYLLDTDDRHKLGRWKTLFSATVPVAGQAAILVDSVRWTHGENHRLECLLASVEEVEGEIKEKHRSPWITVLTWASLLSVDGKSWSMERTRRLEGSHPVEYASVERKGECIHVVSASEFRMVEDTLKPVNAERSDLADDVARYLYTWSQSCSQVCLQVTIPEGLTKPSLSVDISGSRLELVVKNGLEMIKGNLYARVEVDSSTWTLDGRMLEVTLHKVEPVMWPTVILGDSRGQLLATADQIEVIHERLAHLTSEDWNPTPDVKEKPYNCQMLEECDAVDEAVIITRIDGDTHTTTHKVVSGNQFLFSVATDPDNVPTICLRHDVDAFLWQASRTITADKCPWEHIGVLNAIGYVIASKQQRRFCTCSPNMSVAVIAESQRHIYLYRQKVTVTTPLRNRKTGQQVSNVAKQQVLALECSPDVILGLRVTNSKIFIATEQKVLIYVMSPDI